MAPRFGFAVWAVATSKRYTMRGVWAAVLLDGHSPSFLFAHTKQESINSCKVHACVMNFESAGHLLQSRSLSPVQPKSVLELHRLNPHGSTSWGRAQRQRQSKLSFC